MVSTIESISASANQATGSNMDKLVVNFLKDETGSTAIEYGLIAAIISVGMIASLQNVRADLQATFNRIASELQNASN